MAYLVTNPPVRIVGALTSFGAAQPGRQVWVYESADAIATVDAANYISNGQLLGMQVGDIVLVFDTATPALSLCFVLSKGTVNSVNLNHAGAITAT